MAGFIDSFKRNFTGGDDFDKRAKDLHKRFINDMNNMADHKGYIPKIFSMDMKYNYRLQQNRAAKYGVDIKRKYIIDDKSTTGVSVLMGNDKKYITRIPVTTCQFEKDFSSDDKSLRKSQSGGTIFSYVVFAKDQNSNATYCCPNCGDINTVSQLLEQGCRSCRARFLLPDLYPRITNFYTVRNKPYVRTKPFPFVLIGIIAALIFFFLTLPNK